MCGCFLLTKKAKLTISFVCYSKAVIPIAKSVPFIDTFDGYFATITFLFFLDNIRLNLVGLDFSVNLESLGFYHQGKSALVAYTFSIQ
jgi:hypothetical protein